jgi:hypothetical protein
MKSEHESFDQNEWTAEERAQLDALSRELAPPRELKTRTIRGLRGDGHLRPTRDISLRVVAGLLLAASLVFSAGALVGYRAAQRRASPRETAVTATRHDVARIDSDTTSSPVRHVVWY